MARGVAAQSAVAAVDAWRGENDDGPVLVGDALVMLGDRVVATSY